MPAKGPVDKPTRRTDSTLVTDQKAASMRIDPKTLGVGKDIKPPASMDQTKGDDNLSLERNIKTVAAGIR